ncbi:MAG: toxin-antitoxin system YwqK family antitoxin [Chlorobi bacterium]|nr:toxin-antitoxin system YwqK family antitoxin [Chlorobiota bacterium]
MKALKLLTVLWSLAAFQWTYAQVQALTSDVETRNGVVYFEGKPFSGELYSDDEADIPNDCHCTLLEHYRNGLKHGEQLAFYANGKPKFKGAYREGVPIGTHVYYDRNGRIKRKIIYEDGEPVKEEEYENGQTVHVVIYRLGHPAEEKFFFSNGKVKQHIVYHEDGKKDIIAYHENGNKAMEEHYLNGRLHGTRITYDENGEKMASASYQNGRLTEEGGWKNGRKHGLWQYYPDENKIIVVTYEHGTEKSRETLNETHRIRSFRFRSSDRLVMYHPAIKNEYEFSLIRNTPEVDNATDPGLIQIRDKINRELTVRGKVENPHDHPDAFIKYVVELTDMGYKVTPFTYEETHTDKNGNKYTEKKKAYKAVIDYRLVVTDSDGRTIARHSYEATSEGNFGRGLLQAITKNYPLTADDAFARAYRNIKVYKTLKTVFPYYAKIDRVLRKSGSRIRTVHLDLPYAPKGAKFAYKPGEGAKPVVILKVSRSDSEGAVAKVVRGGDWLKEHLNSITDVYFKEY